MGRLSRRFVGKGAGACLQHRFVLIQINFLAERNSTRYNRFTMDFSAHSIIWTLFIGLIVGGIAKLLMPGKDPGGCIITILLGIAGAFVGTWIGRVFAGGNYVAGWIMSVVGAMILLLLYRFLFKRKQ
jgi:uncharacterized membrane protein YeaQ/YmgE (transglycosylase-associated protein family)